MKEKKNKIRRDPMTVQREIQEKIRNGSIRIILASQKKTKKFGKQVDLILKALKIDSALITDESTLNDYLMGADNCLKETELKRIQNELGLPIQINDCIADIAEQLAKKQKQKK